MIVDQVPVYPGNPCPHSTGNGYDHYYNRPTDPCVNFSCEWIIHNSPFPDWMKPKNGKVIAIFNKLRWNVYPVALAVPVGKRIPPRSLDWLERSLEENTRLLVYTEQVGKSRSFQKKQQLFGYGPPAFVQDLRRWRKGGKKLW